MAEAETEDPPESGEGPEPEETDLDKSEVYSEILEGTDYTAETLEPAYSEISEDDYIIDEDEDYVIFETSAWQEIDEILESEASEDENNSFWDRAKNYLFNHDKEYAAGGLTGIATGFLAESLGYMTAASALVTGGGAMLGWGIGGYLGKKISDYWNSSEDEEPQSHELAEFPDYEVKFLKEDAALDAT